MKKSNLNIFETPQLSKAEKKNNLLHLNDGLLFRSQILLHILFQSSQHHWLQNTLQLLNLKDK